MDDGDKLGAAGIDERQFGVKEGSLGGEHVEIACPPSLIPLDRESPGGLQGGDLLLLRPALLSRFLNRDQPSSTSLKAVRIVFRYCAKACRAFASLTFT